MYKNAYSGLNKNVWLLGFVMFINRMGTMVLAFLTLYCIELGYTIEQGGIVVAIYGLGSMIGAFFGGKLSDRFGFYNIQFSALFLGGVMFMVLGQMESYLAICTCTFVLSMINESFRPANATAIAHYSKVKNRTKSFSLVRLAINLGWGVGIGIGGFLASFNYHLLFWVDGGTSILAAILLIILLPKVSLHDQNNPVADESDTAGIPPLFSAYRDKSFLFFLGFILLFAICFFQLFTTVPVYFKENLLLDEFWIGVVMSVNGILIALFEMVMVFKMEGRRPYLIFIGLGSILMGIAFLTLNLSFLPGLLVAMIAVIIITVAEMVSMPFMNSYYINRSSQRTRGQYAALYTMAWSAAQIIGSSSGAAIAHEYGFLQLWLITFVICVITALGFFRLQQKHSTLTA